MTRTARTVLLTIVAFGSMAFIRPAAAQTGLFEVESSDAVKLLQLQDDAGFVVTGAFGGSAIPATGAGARLMWYPGKAAFRAGRVDGDQWDDASVGSFSAAVGERTTASGTGAVALGRITMASGNSSTAMGASTVASGSFSTAAGTGSVASGESSLAVGRNALASGLAATAMGAQTKATGPYSTALNASTEASGGSALATGAGTVASADNSTAMGLQTIASGDNSTAMGLATKATGNSSTAMGRTTTAAGVGSVAMGSAVTAAGDGSFVFGDRNTSFGMTALANEFRVRAFGGVVFNSGVNIGCVLPANTGAWACTSSRLAKEGFTEVDGEEVLIKLAAMPIERWRYLGSPAEHVGPVAEDFHAAFGLGEGSTRIATVDADGIALRAIQALERRTAALADATTALRSELTGLRAENDSLRVRVSAVEGRGPRFDALRAAP